MKNIKPKGHFTARKKEASVKVVIDTAAAAKGAASLRKMFEQMRDKIIQMFLDWLESEEGQAAMKKAIREELKK